jgi:hypothetical protein
LERGEDLNASPKWLNIILAYKLTRALPAGTVCVGLSAQLCSTWGILFTFFENVQVFCAAPPCPVAAAHSFLNFFGSELKQES